MFSLQNPVPPDVDLKHCISISAEAFQNIFESWQRNGLQILFPWQAFEQTDFPPKELFEHLLGLYFSCFHQTLPFLHPVSFNAMDADWLLLLAMMAIGSRYLAEDADCNFATSLQELLRRTLFCLEESSVWNTPNTLTMAQIRMLQAIGLVYSGNGRHVRLGLDMQQLVASTYATILTEWSNPALSQHSEDENQWNVWIQQEEVLRTAYSMWLLDSMWAYQFQRRSMLALGDVVLPLPSHEKLWSAANAEQWKAQSTHQTQTPTLPEALQHFYIDKRLPKDRGEFARILMIHGLFQQTWEVGRYFSNPLAQWKPTAKKQSSAETLPSRPVWLPSIPTYTKWQNSVCDCLDILHWQANATIGQASGLEHPTVAFLHLARVVLLSPIDSIVRLAKAMIGSGEGYPPASADDKKLIQRWSVQGNYKARLAAIHAGVVFWHIRRYSVDGFYEAPAVGLAALMLWAFGTFSVKQSTSQQQQASSNQVEQAQPQNSQSESQEEGSDDSACDIILLDRPADDEIVQQFIRRGHTMRAHITSVGDLYGPRGPERVLVEGCKLLRTLKCWGVNTTWLDILQRLLEVCKK